MKRILYISFIFLMLPVLLLAQPKLTSEAYQAYEQKNLTEAKSLIDQSAQTNEGKSDAMTWHIKGFIYKDLYNQNKVADDRTVAIEAFLRSIELDNTKQFEDNNQKALQYLASTYYNEAVLLIRNTDKATIVNAEKLYQKYKSITKITDPDSDFTERDISFYKALATGNRKVYESDRENNKEFLTKTIENYTYVLQLDPDDYGANYNMAINLYNEGAYNIEHLDIEAQIPTLVKVQAISVELFKEALPYMLKAHELNPEREETLKGLRGIYLSLSDDEQANKYRDLLINQQQTKGQ